MNGEHTVLDRLDPVFLQCFEEVVTSPETGLMLGFEAQDFLASQLDGGYDLYCYLEDDLVISDPQFFQKLAWLRELLPAEDLVLPQRVEFGRGPHPVDRFFIDGPLDVAEVNKLHLKERPPLVLRLLVEMLFLNTKKSSFRLFFLSSNQLRHWRSQNYWLDRDSSFISSLESAATLGISKAFTLLKPAFSHASWLSLLGNIISLSDSCT